MTATQATHAFHALLFAIVIQYSSLSGGQQLNDWRGGVCRVRFGCCDKWFGVSEAGGAKSHVGNHNNKGTESLHE
jgi:hypothetical protein